MKFGFLTYWNQSTGDKNPNRIKRETRLLRAKRAAFIATKFQ